MDISKLQNGSDIRGIAIDTKDQKANLTESVMKKIASGLYRWLRKQQPTGSLKIAVGKDSRLSGEALKKALIDQLLKEGVHVIDCGLATTPAMFMTTQFPAFDCDAGVMLTASHLPYFYNGVKIFSRKGGAEKEDIQSILSPSAEIKSTAQGQYRKQDLLTPYAEDLVEKIRQGMAAKEAQPLKGLKIIVDAGNGSGGFFAEKVLQPLGADTNGSQFLEPDGNFPNHIPNPDNKEAMASIQKAVLYQQADLGIIFDTDVDRSAVVTKRGAPLNRNNLIAVLSSIVLKEHPGGHIVTNSPTSNHLKSFIENLGGRQVRYISGYRNVINKAITLNEEGVNTPLAIETSGHAAFKENYFLDDGAYVVAKLLMELPQLQKSGATFDDLLLSLEQPAETLELRFKIEADDYQAYGKQVIQSVEQSSISGWKKDAENEEGVRFDLEAPYGSGWFLLRLSLHEPLLVLQIENDQKGYMVLVLKKIQELLADFDEINQTKLLQYLAEKTEQ